MEYTGRGRNCLYMYSVCPDRCVCVGLGGCGPAHPITPQALVQQRGRARPCLAQSTANPVCPADSRPAGVGVGGSRERVVTPCAKPAWPQHVEANSAAGMIHGAQPWAARQGGLSPRWTDGLLRAPTWRVRWTMRLFSAMAGSSSIPAPPHAGNRESRRQWGFWVCGWRPPLVALPHHRASP